MDKRYAHTKHIILLSVAGLIINCAFAQFALAMKLPLFLDSIGTILSAALGGYLPGILVGFFSNVVNSLSDPISLYYALVNILLACAAAFFSQHGWFDKPGKSVLSVLIFFSIGGCLGSVLTWLLYGFNFGNGISAPCAIALQNATGLSDFCAQFIADLLIDLADKSVTVLLCVAVLRVLPVPLLQKLSDGQLPHGASPSPAQTRFIKIRCSLRGKVLLLISASAIILSVTATAISGVIYSNIMIDRYMDTATSVSEMAAGLLNGDHVSQYVFSGVTSEEYYKEAAKLQDLRDSIPDIEYVYVYHMAEDGCHVVFDADTADVAGSSFGDVIPMDDAFLRYKDALLAGKPIDPIIAKGRYGWLLSVYTPIINSYGFTVAYAAADISMVDVISDRAVFMVKMASLLFAVSIVIVAFALLFAERRLVDPINAIAETAADFAYSSEEQRRDTTAQLESLNIHTGDEIENLYGALRKTVNDVTSYIEDISQKNRIITQMQHNTIISFASMVESRDMNTGQHIKHTAAYVDVIAHELQREGKYAGTIDEAYIDKIVRSAPLHDLGKIEVPDSILNKPGRLTPEEFDQIKTHTTAGRRILLGIMANSGNADYLSEAVNMAAYHHERWDGTGYPEGLRGEEIPISARIMAVADVYDALISKRSYKDAMSAERAVEIIRSESGTHFDPAVVDAFLRAGDALRKVGE